MQEQNDSIVKQNIQSQGEDANGRGETITVYHGTSEFFLPGIKKEGGIISSRRSGLVYMTSDIECAKVYAACWSIALHVLGVAPSRNGIVVVCTTPVSSPICLGQMSEFSIDPGLLTLESIKKVKFVSDDHRDAGWMFQFLGIMAGGNDFSLSDGNHYSSTMPYATWMEIAKQYIKRVPKDVLNLAISQTACF